MIKKEIRRAKQRKDWQQVKLLVEIHKLETETRLAEKNIQKAQYDMKASLKNFVVAVIGVVVTAMGLAVNALLKK